MGKLFKKPYFKVKKEWCKFLGRIDPKMVRNSSSIAFIIVQNFAIVLKIKCSPLVRIKVERKKSKTYFLENS